MKFPPERRVRKRPEFQEIQRLGRRIPTRHFVLIISSAANPTDLPRMGITASRRVGNSVRRSRLKRIVRAAFQQLDGFLPPGFNLVVICKKDAETLTTETTVQEWLSAQKRVKKVTCS